MPFVTRPVSYPAVTSVPVSRQVMVPVEGPEVDVHVTTYTPTTYGSYGSCGPCGPCGPGVCGPYVCAPCASVNWACCTPQYQSTASATTRVERRKTYTWAPATETRSVDVYGTWTQLETHYVPAVDFWGNFF